MEIVADIVSVITEILWHISASKFPGILYHEDVKQFQINYVVSFISICIVRIYNHFSHEVLHSINPT